MFYVQAGGYQCNARVTGSPFFGVAHGLTGVSRQKIALEVDRAAGTGKFFRMISGAWVQQGATQSFTSAAWTAATASFAGVIGAGVTDTKVYSVKFINGGTTILDWNFAQVTNGNATSFTPTVGPSVSFNRGTAGRKLTVVTRPVWLFGTDDYLEVADNDSLDFGPGQDHTIVALTRWWATPVAYGAVVVKNQTSPFMDGWTLAHNNGSGFAPRFYEEEVGSTDVAGIDGSSSAGQFIAFSGVRDGVFMRNYVNNTVNSVNATGVDDLRNTGAMRIGSTSLGQYFADMEVFAVAVFRRALNATEIAAIVSSYGAS